LSVSKVLDPPKSPLKRGTLIPVPPLKRGTLIPVPPLKRGTLIPVPPLKRGTLIPVPPFLRGVRGDLKMPKVTGKHFSNNLLETARVISY
jgi:hypothetical protein